MAAEERAFGAISRALREDTQGPNRLLDEMQLTLNVQQEIGPLGTVASREERQRIFAQVMKKVREDRIPPHSVSSAGERGQPQQRRPGHLAASTGSTPHGDQHYIPTLLLRINDLETEQHEDRQRILALEDNLNTLHKGIEDIRPMVLRLWQEASKED